jgi:hypothetical protein
MSGNSSIAFVTACRALSNRRHLDHVATLVEGENSLGFLIVSVYVPSSQRIWNDFEVQWLRDRLGDVPNGSARSCKRCKVVLKTLLSDRLDLIGTGTFNGVGTRLLEEQHAPSTSE